MVLMRRVPWAVGWILVTALFGCGESSSAGDDGSGGGSAAQAGSGATGGAGGSATGGSATGGSTTGGSATGGSAGATGGSAGMPPTGSFPMGFGPPEPIVTGLTFPARLGMKDGYLYFTEAGLDDGTHSRLARRAPSGNVETLFAGNRVVALHLDDTELFFVERGTSTVYRMSYATLEPVVFTTTTMTVADVDRNGEMIWITEYTSAQTNTAVSVFDRAGTLLAQPVPPSNPGFFFTYLAVGGGNVYVSTVGSNTALYKIPPSGTGGITVPSVDPQFIAADASHVYFTSLSDGTVLRQAHSATMQPEELATDQAYPFAIAVDGSGAYWTNGGDCVTAPVTGGSVMGTPLAGSAPVAVATGERCPQAIATDADYVYWTREADYLTVGDDSIVRARKLLP